MADFNEIQTEVAQDEEIVDVPIFKKDGSPFLAPDGETQCTIGVRGSDAKKVKAAREANQRKLLRDRRAKLTPEECRNRRHRRHGGRDRCAGPAGPAAASLRVHAGERPRDAGRRSHPRPGGRRDRGSRGFFREELDALIEAVRATAQINRRQKDGSTARTAPRAAAQKNNALAIEKLAAADAIPDSLEYLADIFYRLPRCVNTDMNGPKRFTPAHIKAGMELFGWSLSALDVGAIVELDGVYLEASAPPRACDG
jgi:hypothetical protein